MRRTRHIMLPVRSWQYIGLLVVSLACLTLGHVSRDREGRAGSLAGPELQHTAPHEVDACPNYSPFTDSSCQKIDETRVPSTKIDHDTSRVSFATRRLSRSLDRVSRTRYQDAERRTGSRIDPRSTRRVVREVQNRISDREARRTVESTGRNRQDRTTKHFSDPSARLSRSVSAVDSRSSAARSFRRESQESEGRRGFTERRLYRGVLERRNSERRNRLELNGRSSRSLDRVDSRNVELRERREISDNLRARKVLLEDRRSRLTDLRRSNDIERRVRREDSNTRRSMERIVDRRARSIDRNDRLDVRERRIRSVERRELNRMERRELTRDESRENRRVLLNRVNDDRRSRSFEREIDRRSVLRTSRRQENERSRENEIPRRYNRQFSRMALDERRNSYRSLSADRIERTTTNRREAYRNDELSRRQIRQITSASERATSRQPHESERNVDRNDLRRVRVAQSVDRRTDRNLDAPRERRLTRRIVITDRQRENSRIRDSRTRSNDKENSLDSRRERMNMLRVNTERRNLRRLSTGRTSRLDTDRRSFVRTERRDVSSLERREPSNRIDRRLTILSNERHDLSASRSSRVQATSNDRRQREAGINRRDSRIRAVRDIESSRRVAEQRRERRVSENERRIDRRAAVERRNLDSGRLVRDRSITSQLRNIRSRSLDDIRTVRQGEERRMIGNTLSDSRRTQSIDLTTLRNTRNLKDLANSRNSVRNIGNRNADNILEISYLKSRSYDARDRLTQRNIRTRNMESRMMGATFPMKTSNNYELMQQALILMLCTVYGLSLFKTKGSYLSNIMNQASRFVLW